MSALPKPTLMTVEEFLEWPGDGTGRTFQLVNGEPCAMAPTSPTHGTLQSMLDYLLMRHFLETGRNCRPVATPGVIPRVRANVNTRIPDIAITCEPDEAGQRTVPHPILLIEILSPTNERETWEAVWTYTTIPSVREILILHSVRMEAHLLRRAADGSWPEQPEAIGPAGTLTLESVGFACVLREIYAGTRFARG